MLFPRALSYRDALCCGIDCGCSATRAFLFREEEERGACSARELCNPVPTLVALTSHMLIGKEAMRETETRHNNALRHLPALLSPPRVAQLRYKDEERYIPVDFAIALIVEQVAAKTQGAPARWVMAIPTALSPSERQRFAAAASAGTRSEVDLLPSPLAVAVHYATTVLTRAGAPPTVCALIIDAGACFTSVSLVRFLPGPGGVGRTIQELGCHGLRRGGHDVTVALAEQLGLGSLLPTSDLAESRANTNAEGDPDSPLKRTGSGASLGYSLARRGSRSIHPLHVLGAVNQAKHELSSLREATVKVGETRIDVTREHLAAAASELIAEVTAAARRLTVLEQPTVALVVGGGSRLCALQELVTQELGLTIEVMDPDQACAMGCADWAARRKHSAVGMLRPSPPQGRFFTANSSCEVAELVTDRLLDDKLGCLLFSDESRDQTAVPTRRDFVQAIQSWAQPVCDAPTPLAILPEAEAAVLTFCGHITAPGANVFDGPASVPCGLTLEGGTPEELAKSLEEERLDRGMQAELAEARNALEEALIAREDAEEAAGADADSPPQKFQGRPMLEVAWEWAKDSRAHPPYAPEEVRQLTLGVRGDRALLSPSGDSCTPPAGALSPQVRHSPSRRSLPGTPLPSPSSGARLFRNQRSAGLLQQLGVEPAGTTGSPELNGSQMQQSCRTLPAATSARAPPPPAAPPPAAPRPAGGPAPKNQGGGCCGGGCCVS